MRSRINRKRSDTRREKPFFSKSSEQADRGTFFEPQPVVDAPSAGLNRKEDEQTTLHRQQEDEEASVRRQSGEQEEEAVRSQVEEEEESVQTQKEDQEEEAIQAKAEEEEDAARAKDEDDEAARAKQQETESVRAQEGPEEEEAVRAKPLQANEAQRSSSRSGSRPAPAEFESLLEQRKGLGRPLPPATLEELEAAFGADFSDIRIHTDEQAAELSQMIGAQAFTQGNEIFFNSGKFDPSSEQGKRLLAHELTHARQQAGR